MADRHRCAKACFIRKMPSFPCRGKGGKELASRLSLLVTDAKECGRRWNEAIGD